MNQHHLIQIDTIAKKIIGIAAIALFAVMVVILIYALLLKPILATHSMAFNDFIGLSIKYIAIGLFLLLLIAVCVRLMLSPFVKSDEETEFEQKVDYVLQQRQQPKPAKDNHTVVSPLCNLTPEEEEIVCNIIKNLPAHYNKPDHINLAQTSHYLTALQQLGYLDDKDRYNLRLWLIQLTERAVPETSQFNESYPSKTVKKVQKAKQHIEKELEKIR